MKFRLSPFLLICIMGGLAIFSSTMSKNPVLPLFIRALDVPVATVGFIAAASTVIGIVVSLPAGILSDIIGRRRLTLVALVLFATAPFLYLLVSLPWHLVLVRVYHGLATAILGPVAMAAVADTLDRRRGERMGRYSAATMVGRFAAPFVAGALVLGEDFRWVYLTTGVFGTLALLAALRLRRRRPEARARPDLGGPQGPADTSRHLVHQRHRGRVVLRIRAPGGLPPHLPQRRSRHGHPAYRPALHGADHRRHAGQTVDGAPLRPPWSFPMIVIGLLIGGAAMAAVTRSGDFFVLAVLVGLFGMGLATVTASSAALVADVSRSTSRGSALGILSSIMDIGHSTDPMVGGLLISAYRYDAAFGIVGAGLALAAIAFSIIAMRGVRTEPTA